MRGRDPVCGGTLPLDGGGCAAVAGNFALDVVRAAMRLVDDTRCLPLDGGALGALGSSVGSFSPISIAAHFTS